VTPLIRHLRLALSVGVVGGFVFGCREALLTLQANAVVQPGHYFFLYLVVPILAWMGIGVVVTLLTGSVAATLAGAREPRSLLGLHAGALAFLGVFSAAAAWVGVVAALLQNVGMPAGHGVAAALWLAAVALSLGVAATVGAAATWYGQVSERPLRYATGAVLLATPLLLWPPIWFFATDWKWTTSERAALAGALKRPNVVLISIDTLRADHLGSYGDAHGLTPHLDQLARDGLSFDQAMSASPWTLPAMASLFTGLYPRHHGAGVITNGRTPLGRSALPSGSWTLTTALQEQGYRTHAVVTSPYLALRYGFGNGFDSYENVTIESEAFLSFADTTAVRLFDWVRPDLIIGDRGESVSRRAQRWLATVESDRPFFLWLHYIDPHPPYSRAGATRHKSMRGDLSFGMEDAHASTIALTSPDVARLRSGEIRLNAEEKEAVRELYRAEVASVDSAVGLVLDTLREQGLQDDTLVVCVADHGEEFWEHGSVEHGHTVYEELVRVPLLMRWPGHLPAGRHVAPLVRVIDIVPTVLDLLGLPQPARLDGASMAAVWNGTEAAPRSALVENLLFAEERVALRTADEKYIRWDSGREEVYDLRNDPQELRDVAAITGTAEPLRLVYAELERDREKTARPVTAPVLDERTRAALRALGYAQ
jgi:arylsulfatase A-like enzyme